MSKKWRDFFSGVALQFLLPVFAAVATLLNGSVFWARRVGLLEPERYWLPYNELVRGFAQNRTLEAVREIQRFGRTLHDVEGFAVLSKLAKDAVWLTVLIILLVNIRRVKLIKTMAISYGGFAALALHSVPNAMLRSAWMQLAAGIRANLCWLLGALGSSLATPALCRIVARTCVVVLVCQAPLICAELVNGLIIYKAVQFGSEYARAAGSFSVPISLGSFAVITWTLARLWGELSQRLFALITLVCVLILIVSASAAAWLALIITAASMVYFQQPLRRRIIILLASLPLLIAVWAALPRLTGRGAVHDSAWGRIHLVHVHAQQLTGSEILFGLGLGIGTNSLTQLALSQESARQRTPRPGGDSTPAILFWQFGLAGLSLAYTLMLFALRAAPHARPIGVALIITSLAVNVTELFPLNLIFGLWLAHAARVAINDRCK